MKSRKNVRFPHSAITRSPGLLPMLYSINELCIELDIPRHLIRSWLQNGLPHQRDQHQHIWINGEECTLWIEENRKSQKRTKTLAEYQAYCFRCQSIIAISNPRIITERGNSRLIGLCPDCEGIVNKGVSNDQPKQLQTDTGVP